MQHTEEWTKNAAGVFMHQNHDTIMRYTVMVGPGYLDYAGFYNMHWEHTLQRSLALWKCDRQGQDLNQVERVW